MYGVEGIEWLFAIAGAIMVGVCKMGFPSGILFIPLFAAIIPAKASTGVVLPLLIMGDVLAVSIYRRHASWGHIARLFPWTFAGVVTGYILLGRISDNQLKPVIGIIILVMLALNAWRNWRSDPDVRVPARMIVAAPAGMFAGITTMMANAAGPVMTVYMLAMKLPKTAFIGTAAWYFCLLNLVKVPFSANLDLINAESLKFNLVLAPALVAGAGLGFVLVRRIPERPFNIVVQVLAAIGGIYLLW